MVLVLVLSHHLCHWVLPCFPPSGGVSTWDTVRQVSLRARGNKHKGSVSSKQRAAGAHTHTHARTCVTQPVGGTLLDVFHKDVALWCRRRASGLWRRRRKAWIGFYTLSHAGEKYRVRVTVDAGRDSRRALEAASSDFPSAGDTLQQTHNRLLTGPPSNCSGCKLLFAYMSLPKLLSTINTSDLLH